MRWKCTVAYDGTDFDGWQSQPGKNTIQDLLEAALSIASTGVDEAEVRSVVVSVVERNEAQVEAAARRIPRCETIRLAGLGQLAFTGNVSPLTGDGQELIVIAAVIIGGTDLFGGEGTMSGTVLGALVGLALARRYRGTETS